MNKNQDWLYRIKGEVKYDEPLSLHTSFRIGGPADVFISPQNIEDLRIIFKYAKETPVFILGEGTNLLINDEGFRGIVISLKESFKAVKDVMFSDNQKTAQVEAGSGVKLSYLAKYAARHSLSGLEPLVGIPGSLGGALIMNAGAEGTEIGTLVKSITRVTREGAIQIFQEKDLSFKYRKTVFPPGDGVIVKAELELQTGDRMVIQEKIDGYLQKRGRKQPLSQPNSGSIFKNPPNQTAGKLIEEAGLKGTRMGDAAVSSKHANFIVNKGHACASEVMELIEHIQRVVKEKTGVELEREIIWV
ncbi:MAG: UDP-N-acetylmuramate dehydrogenase [Nitrospinota bacterium]|nr:UDP-N-acetylmuramate dehydrogenase [Nitrospinota bacterium]